jgi:excisionase family DNA binding protein
MSSSLTFKKICEFCGKEFEAKTLYTRYCNHTCNSRHYKKMKRDEKIQSVLQPQQAEPEQQKFDNAIQRKEFLSVDEAATLLGASRRTIQRMIAKGALKIGKLGRRIIISRKEIDKLFI